MADEIVNVYICDDCSYRYDPSNFHGVDLDAQSDSFECPQCQAGKDHFHLFEPPSDDVAPELDGTVDDNQKPDPTGPRLMYKDEISPSLTSLYGQWTKKRLDTQPDFQRYEVWSIQKKSALIESILLDLPIPQVYLAEEPDNSSVVVDGQQRLAAIFGYMSGDYALKGVAATIEGKKCSELGNLQETIDNYPLRVIKIRKESDPEVRFMLFQRLNEGSVSLNDQELRNCVWRGPYNDLLKSLAEDPAWRKLLNLKKRHLRMADVELVLRFMAFHDHPQRELLPALRQPSNGPGMALPGSFLLGPDRTDITASVRRTRRVGDQRRRTLTVSTARMVWLVWVVGSYEAEPPGTSTTLYYVTIDAKTGVLHGAGASANMPGAPSVPSTVFDS